jgi:hypothetical protein
MWSAYHGTQQGDPAKLGDALVNIAGIENLLELFVAGSDGLTIEHAGYRGPAQEVRAYEELLRSTDGLF